MKSLALDGRGRRRAKRIGSRHLTILFWSKLLSITALLLCSGAFALEPPRQGEIELLRRTGELPERVRAAESLRNHRFKPELVERARRKLKKVKDAYLGIAADAESEAFAPPPGWRGL